MTTRRALLRIAKNWPQNWRPLRTGLPRLPHPLPIQLAHVAQWFHAMSDITRIDLLECLSQRDRSVTELAEILDAPQPSVSFHLRVLKDSGLACEYRSGRQRFYSLQGETLENMRTFVQLIGPGMHVGTCPLTCCRSP